MSVLRAQECSGRQQGCFWPRGKGTLGAPQSIKGPVWGQEPGLWSWLCENKQAPATSLSLCVFTGKLGYGNVDYDIEGPFSI